jgi:NAD(P)-dependent dehydrogenase (short-subunit alcohol dehydrogenase family)
LAETNAKTWFITGTSKGFGRIWAEAALERGDSVAATARDASTLEPLLEAYGERVLVQALDVTDKAAVDAAVAAAHERFGRLDVVVHNAGYGYFGTIEEVDEAGARAQIETNLFGALWVTKAALPILREQGSGHFIQVSSIGGVTAFPGIGLYHASKWGLEGFSQALAREVGRFGVRVTLVEPIGYTTDWAGPSAVTAEPMPEYEWIREERAKGTSVRSRRGAPDATAAPILEIVDAEEPPLRVLFGDWALEQLVRPEYEERLATWERWQDLSRRAHGGEE